MVSMVSIERTVAWTAVACGLLLCSVAWALSPADKCESSELKTSGKYAFCRLKAEAKAVKTGGSPLVVKCDATFGYKFGQADTEGMGQCPSSASQAAIQAFITQCTDDVAAALGGAPLPVCQPPPLKTGQTTAYGTGSDGDLQKGASHSFTDNGDGTITDNTTGLMWEKKDASGVEPHDWHKTYTWCADASPTDGFCDNGPIMDGTITTVFLAALNGGSGFAGHTDWRIPNINELESIRNLEKFDSATYSAFDTGCTLNCTVTTCSCTWVHDHWSSTTYQYSTDFVWTLYFYDGDLHYDAEKTDLRYARAVRNAP